MKAWAMGKYCSLLDVTRTTLFQRKCSSRAMMDFAIFPDGGCVRMNVR